MTAAATADDYLATHPLIVATPSPALDTGCESDDIVIVTLAGVAIETPLTMEAILASKSSMDALDHILTTDDEFRLMGMTLVSAVDTAQLTKRFKKISLLIHPDKCKDQRATEAMQKLVSARDDLLDVHKLPGNSGAV